VDIILLHYLDSYTQRGSCSQDRLEEQTDFSCEILELILKVLLRFTISKLSIPCDTIALID
jgi:hypothetical protein